MGATIPLLKMNGLGNEITVLDLRETTATVTEAAVRAIHALSDFAFDQLMVLYAPTSTGSDARIAIYNSDGSLAGACGNGMRCVAHLLSADLGRDRLLLETASGLLEAVRNGDGRYSIDMGVPRFGWQEIPLSEPFHDTRRIELQIGPIDQPVLHSPSVVNVGNPHCIFWVQDVAAHDLERIGPLIENHPLFPDRVNVSLAQVTSPTAITLRVWERGAGLTRACGSAACAAAVAASRKHLTERSVAVTLPGGVLDIVWREDDHIIMTGPAELEQRGSLDPSILV